MPLCTLHLIRLHRDGNGDVNQDRIYAKRKQFLQRLVTSPLGARLIVACVIRRPIIVANRIDPVYLNATRWDLLLIISPEKDLPQTGKARQEDPPTPFSLKDQPKIQDDISDEYLLDIGVPTKILDAYSQRSKSFKEEAQKAKKIKIESLVENPARAHPGYKPKTSQLLEMSDDLVALSKELEELASSDGLVDANGPVQQLNLLCFKKSKEDKDRYYKYGQEFANVAAKFGGAPKILGGVVTVETRDQQPPRWDEVALVNYHSIQHFAAMAASEEYQQINRKYRLPSLDDTTIICTQEVDLEGLRSGSKARM